jgi:putative addiction module CopG family antidote
MEITLAPEHEEYIEASVSSGRYASRAEALNAAVEELRRRNEYRAYVQAAVAEGMASLERGEGTTFTAEELREHFGNESVLARAKRHVA